MNLFELLITEYISIVETLEVNEPIISNRIIIEREHFKSLLEKYQYMKFKEKTKVYKDLNLIVHDKNNYTMPYKDTQSKKTVRKVIINYDTYQTIKGLFKTMVQ